MKGIVAILLFGVAATGAQQAAFQCSHDFGFYAHDVACDQYWSCDGGVATLKTCGNGLAFDNGDTESLRENCDYYHNVDCTTRPERQPPISTPNCPYQYGIFADEVDCSVFWSCWGGKPSRYECGPGLAYSLESRVCTWIDKVPGCETQRAAETNNFQCPASGTLIAAGSFTRHPHTEDCRQFYVCLDTIPREYGCPIGTVFKIGLADGEGQCSDPETVPGCESYYGELDLKAIKQSQLLLGNFGRGTAAPARKQQIEAQQNSRLLSRPQTSRQQQPIQVQEPQPVQEAPLN